MRSRLKNSLLSPLFALLIGTIIGAIVWGFLRLVHFTTTYLWETLPNQFNIPCYTILICLFGGLLIGLFRKFFGDYPESMETVIKKVKTTHAYPYKKLPIMLIGSFLPLIFGASVGPEAGLVGIVIALCYWANAKFQHLFLYLKTLTEIGVSATLGAIFRAPLFGFMLPLETSQDKSITIPKSSRLILTLFSIFGALGIITLLGHFFGGNFGLADFTDYHAATKE